MKFVRGSRCDISFSFLLIIGICQYVVGVRINRLQVPEVTQLGAPVVLDCDYTLEGPIDEGLVVKWFFNEKPTPIYQWIPNNEPQELGILKGRLNLKYSASEDSESVHRALHILEPGPDLSGDYTCLVSTFNNEDKRTKRMLVFVPEKRLELHQERVDENTLRLVCSAEGVSPRPDMSLHIGNSEVNTSRILVEEQEGLFNITATVELPALKALEEFSCELRIPQANYTVRKEAIYYPSDFPVSVNKGMYHHLSSPIFKSSVLLLIFQLLVMLCKYLQ